MTFNILKSQIKYSLLDIQDQELLNLSEKKEIFNPETHLSETEMFNQNKEFFENKTSQKIVIDKVVENKIKSLNNDKGIVQKKVNKKKYRQDIHKSIDLNNF